MHAFSLLVRAYVYTYRIRSLYCLFFVLFAKLKPYDHVGPKGIVELTINTLHKREESKHKRSKEKITEYMCMSSAGIQRNIETRPPNVHIHSIEITYAVRRHIACTVRL